MHAQLRLFHIRAVLTECDKKIHILLDTIKLDKHFIYYFNELFEKIIEMIE